MKIDFRDIAESIGRGTNAAACEPFLRPELERLKNSLFSQVVNTGDTQELLRLSGAALVVETLLGVLDSALDEGKAAQEQLNRK